MDQWHAKATQLCVITCSIQSMKIICNIKCGQACCFRSQSASSGTRILCHWMETMASSVQYDVLPPHLIHTHYPIMSQHVSSSLVMLILEFCLCLNLVFSKVLAQKFWPVQVVTTY